MCSISIALEVAWGEFEIDSNQTQPGPGLDDNSFGRFRVFRRVKFEAHLNVHFALLGQPCHAHRKQAIASMGGAAVGRVRRSAWLVIGSLPLQQIDPMLLHDLQEPSVLDVPEGLVSLVFNQESEIRQQLAEPDIGGQLLEISELLDQLVLGRRGHGTWSPILGSPAYGRRSLPTTSTRIIVPGASLAIRVARVTPLYTTSTPSEAS
jgi:hypothetical protein